jgi:hypothetical protein
MTFETRTNDKPTLAPADFATMAPVVPIDDESWHGSGFRPADVLQHRFPFEDDMSACGACRSRDVRCIYLHYFHHIVESDVRVELVCNACGKFTVHVFERL